MVNLKSFSSIYKSSKISFKLSVWVSSPGSFTLKATRSAIIHSIGISVSLNKFNLSLPYIPYLVAYTIDL